MNLNKTAILGAGSWGTALAWLWARNDRPIILWARHEERAARIQCLRENGDYLPGIKLPEVVRVTSDLRECSGADLIVFVTPSTALREIASQLKRAKPNENAVLLSCTKGIEHGTGMVMSQILDEVLSNRMVTVLSGPNLASEVSRNLPTATVIGCRDQGCATALQTFLGSGRFRIYTSAEVTSVELGGALKNVFAIAAGISDGLGLGENAKAALVTRSLAELVRLGSAMGGNPQTFYGLSGVGDLMVTCYSQSSRNYTVGRRLGQGEVLGNITASMKMVAEGIPTAQSAWECARSLMVNAPIIDQVYAMLYEQKPPIRALTELLRREQKPETS